MSKNLYTGFVTTMVMVLGGTIIYGSEVLAQSSDTNTTRPDVIINGGNNTGTGTNTTPPTNTGTGDTSTTNTETGDKRFTCELNNGKYTVMYNPQGQNKAYAWATPGDMGDTWTAEKRCQTISERLELYRPDGLLELQTSVVKGYDTVCVTTEKDSSCRIVFTVPKGQNAIEIRDRVFQNLTTADSGQTTQGVATYTNRNNGGDIINQTLGSLGLSKNKVNNRAGINLKPFLSVGDGGSGAKLTSGVSINKPTSVKPVNKPVKSKRLNPNILR
ncbi:MAG TPA: COP23 domain-containing protein [Allocoleopsis sp.]